MQGDHWPKGEPDPEIVADMLSGPGPDKAEDAAAKLLAAQKAESAAEYLRGEHEFEQALGEAGGIEPMPMAAAAGEGRAERDATERMRRAKRKREQEAAASKPSGPSSIWMPFTAENRRHAEKIGEHVANLQALDASRRASLEAGDIEAAKKDALAARKIEFGMDQKNADHEAAGWDRCLVRENALRPAGEGADIGLPAYFAACRDAAHIRAAVAKAALDGLQDGSLGAADCNRACPVRRQMDKALAEMDARIETLGEANRPEAAAQARLQREAALSRFKEVAEAAQGQGAKAAAWAKHGDEATALLENACVHGRHDATAQPPPGFFRGETFGPIEPEFADAGQEEDARFDGPAASPDLRDGPEPPELGEGQDETWRPAMPGPASDDTDSDRHCM